MSLLSLVHVLVGLLAVITGGVLLATRKGDRRHRLFGWAYVAFMLVSLAAILIRGASHPSPFHVYAAVTAAGIVAAVAASRVRARIAAWRAWPAVLMSFSMLAAIVAIGGVVAGLVLGLGSGPEYYRVFNVVILGVTLIGLWLINTRSVIWRGIAAETRVRTQFTIFVLTVSISLVAAQWAGQT